MSKTYPTKASYESALQGVKEYEERQSNLKRLANDLSFHLQKFDNFKFKVNKKEGKVLFTGVLKDNGEIKIGESVCSSGDKFLDIIGKLISIKKSLGLCVDDIVEHVESEGIIFGTFQGKPIRGTGINLTAENIINATTFFDNGMTTSRILTRM